MPANNGSITVRFGAATHTIDISDLDATTMAEFQERVAAVTRVPPSNQRIVKQGVLVRGSRNVDAAASDQPEAPQPLSALLSPGDAVALFGLAEGEAPGLAAPAVLPVFETDVLEALSVCSKVYLGTEPAPQPKFSCTYFAEGTRDGPIFDICGPCAHTCWDMRHVHILDEIPALRDPFVCMCDAIVKTDHACYWHGCHVPESQRALQAAMPAAWRREQELFLLPIEEELNKAADKARKEAEAQMTQTLRRAVEGFAQYSDPQAQEAARRVVPTARLLAAAEALRGTRPALDERDSLFLALLRWFKEEFFSWVTTLPCAACQGGTVSTGAGLTPNPEEVANWAGTVEAHRCNACGHVTRFPRYNRATRLLSWRKGRCGEWANCFCLIAVALGFDVRYVLSLSDHVWVELYSARLGRWVHADPCENAFDTPLLYEAGWKSKLGYIFSFSDRECVDVIRRYSDRPLALPDRNRVGEGFLSRLVRGVDADLVRRTPDAFRALVRQRRDGEEEALALMRRPAGGDGASSEAAEATAGRTLGGRTTGTVEWRLARGEMGGSGGVVASTEEGSAAAVPVRRWSLADDAPRERPLGADVSSAAPPAAPAVRPRFSCSTGCAIVARSAARAAGTPAAALEMQHGGTVTTSRPVRLWGGGAACVLVLARPGAGAAASAGAGSPPLLVASLSLAGFCDVAVSVAAAPDGGGGEAWRCVLSERLRSGAARAVRECVLAVAPTAGRAPRLRLELSVDDQAAAVVRLTTSPPPGSVRAEGGGADNDAAAGGARMELGAMLARGEMPRECHVELRTELPARAVVGHARVEVEHFEVAF